MTFLDVRARLSALLNEPRPSPLTRLPPWDLALGVLALAVALLELALRPEITPVHFLVLLATAPALAFRRVHPLRAFLAAFAASSALDVVQLVTGLPPVNMASTLFMLVLPTALVHWGSGREIALGLVATALSFALGVVADGLSLGEALGGVAVLAACFAVGFALRVRAASRRQEVRAARALERTRIARDLHDTVAHHVSGIAVRAQAGLAVAAEDPSAAVEALGVIAGEASRTLEEMRAMVGLLRGDEPGVRAPLVGSQALLALADDARTPPVRLELEGSLEALPAPVMGALHRIAQEAITNARRHARGAQAITLRLRAARELVRLEVVDDGAPVSRRAPAPGYGLLGMRERAELLGGSFEAGPAEGRGWRVVASLPVRGVTP